jgi:hypothetical protein
VTALAARPTDGLLVATLYWYSANLAIDPATGLAAWIGWARPDGLPDDLAFRPLPPPDGQTTVAGRVIDETGAPVAGVLVTVRDLFFSVTGSDGRFVISRVPASFGEVAVSVPPGWFSSNGTQSAPAPVVAAGTTDLGDIVLEADEPPTTLVGVVVNELAEPVPGAIVKIYNSWTVRTTTADGDGAFSVPHLPSQEILGILATAEAGGASLRGQQVAGPEPGGVTDAGPITVYPVEPVADPLTSAAGTVVDSRGVPVAGARVQVFTGWDVFPTITGADGRFLVHGIPTVDGELLAFATAWRRGRLSNGNSDLILPEPGGITDLGEIRLLGEDDSGGGGLQEVSLPGSTAGG